LLHSISYLMLFLFGNNFYSSVAIPVD
jgi:hypothetical protein